MVITCDLDQLTFRNTLMGKGSFKLGESDLDIYVMKNYHITKYLDHKMDLTLFVDTYL